VRGLEVLQRVYNESMAMLDALPVIIFAESIQFNFFEKLYVDVKVVKVVKVDR